ncbi:hypothetical protein tb265_44460 [Gemmatimonadetes bacterium T265]|nr:hypothetical protein tb265_44460 [Gemmatimonadetes bacterium T265]
MYARPTRDYTNAAARYLSVFSPLTHMVHAVHAHPAPVRPDGVRLSGWEDAAVHGSDPAEARLYGVLGALSALTVQLDTGGNITYANDAFLDATGWARAEVLGAEWSDGFVPATCETRALIVEALAGRTARGNGELFTRHGDLRRVAWEVVGLRDSAGHVSGVVCIGRDVTDERRVALERMRLARELATRVDRDALTGLLNRHGFFRETAHAVRVAARTRRVDAMLCVRLEGLAAIYAAHGAAEGDDAVCGVAEVLRAVVRDSDVVARLDADMFVVYAVGTGTPQHGAAAAARVRAAFERHDARARAGGRTFDVTYVVGVAEREPGDAAEAWLARAAMAATVPVRAGELA